MSLLYSLEESPFDAIIDNSREQVFFSTSGNRRHGYEGKYIRDEEVVAHVADSFRVQKLRNVNIVYDMHRPDEQIWNAVLAFVNNWNVGLDARTGECLACSKGQWKPYKIGVIGVGYYKVISEIKDE